MNLLSLNKRRFLGRMGSGLTGVALTRLLGMEAQAAATAGASETKATSKSHFPPKAKQVLQIFCPGAASHMDLWDHKPMLEKFDGTPMPGSRVLRYSPPKFCSLL